MTYRYRVLGATRALRPDGTEVPLSGARLRALLTALVAAGGRAVPAGRLAAQLWGDSRAADTLPADEPAAVQALVGRLRRALGGAALVSEPGGYRLVVDRDDIDLFRFERLAAEGSAALRSGDPSGAVALLDEALALWQGPPLSDLPGHDTAPLAVRAGHHRTEARRTRLFADVACGYPERALPELTAMAAASPLDEPLQATRISALRASGRRAEALEAYEEVRGRLADRLGTDPGSELRALHAKLLGADGAGSGAGDGDRAGSGGPSASRPAASRPAVGNLPLRLSSFVGRESELDAIRGESRAHRLVTLTGPGGAGKTRLALESAGSAGDDWPGGVWLVELASVRDGGGVAKAVLTALGARETVVRGPGGAEAAARDSLTRLIEHCEPRHLLIVLDNCEQVIGAAAELCEAVLTRCPGVTVLATSREPLGVPGEFLYGVGPLPQAQALRLLAERGAAARAGFRTDDDPAACEEICRRLDGLPLAVELAAARLRLLTPRQIADRLEDRFRLLGAGSGSRTVPPRQQTLRAVVDWSWGLLGDDERAVLRRLSVFRGGCASAEADTVCSEDGAPALDALSSLVDKSLVVAAPEDPGAMRYRLLETVAEYARERLDDSGERAAVELRHARAYRELVRTGDPELRGPRQAARLEQFEREHDNVRAALRTAVDREQEQDALCLTLAMSWFWQLRGHRDDARAWSAAAAALGPDPFRAPVRPAVPLADPCTDLPPPWPQEQVWEARRGVRLMRFASGEGDGEPDHLRGIVAAYRPGLPQISRQPGSMWFFARLLTGDSPGMDEALDALVGACRAWPGRGWDLGVALMLRAKLLGAGAATGAGGAEHDGRDGRDADEAVALFERTGDLVTLAEALSTRGESHERRGRYEAAAADFERAMESCGRIGVDGHVPLFKARLASVRLEAAADPAAGERAERLLREAVEESRGYSGQSGGTAGILLARQYGRTGRTVLARDQLHALQGESAFSAQPLFAGLAEGLHGWLDCLDGEYARALDHLRRAVALLDSLAYLVAPHLIASQFPSAAWAKARLGQPADGARLLGAYARHTALAEGFVFHPFPVGYEKEIGCRAETEVRGALDAKTWACAQAEGGALPMKEAAALI